MNITKVQIHQNQNQNTAIKAWADIILDDEFIIRGLVVVCKEDGVHVVNMPSKILKNTSRQDVAHPIKESCRQYIENKVLDEYEEVLNSNPN
jgi:DNA-binding cell septation regulator SpoVG